MTIVFFDGMTRRCKSVEFGRDPDTKRPTVIIDGTDVYDIVVILRIVAE